MFAVSATVPKSCSEELRSVLMMKPSLNPEQSLVEMRKTTIHIVLDRNALDADD